jgi:serine/threonine protein kinase
MALQNLIGEVLDGKYRIEKQLGEGGMGAVYFATHLGTERPVAVKVIAPQFMQHDEFVERFRREARAAGRLRHPNVVDVTDFGFALVGKDQVAYLVMEYLDGLTLDEILAEESSLPLNWVIDILEQTCSAVDEAHQQGIIHRDLKPENIWLEPNRRGGYTVKVLDFGIAKLDEPELQASREASGVLRLPASESATASPASEFPTLIGTTGDTTSGTRSETQASTQQTEAATLMSPLRPTGADLSEAGTQIIVPQAADVSEAGTRILPLETAAEAGTRILEERVTDKHLSMPTGTSSSLTRVGSILGTPLYMSPEQCRGETLDARSDIYSLGVIAYRLLSGKTPFSGTQTAVMEMHREEPPPPLEVKRVPKKVRGLVMRALAKNAADRPPSAAAFASALRAHATGTGTLLRHALTLYSEHLPTFLRLAVLVYWPVVLTTFLKVILQYIDSRHLIRFPWNKIATGSANLLTVVVTFFSASVVVGVTSWLVTQVLAVPLRPLLLRPAFNAMKKRLRPFLLTTLLTNVVCLIGFAMCILPGIYLIANFAMVGPVVMMEDLRGRAAMKRSRALYKRSRRMVFAIMFIHIGAPILVGSISAVLIIALVKLFKPAASEGPAIFSMIQPLVSLPTTILFSSLASVVTALLYWKTRLAGGETLAQALAQFAEEEGVAGRGLKRTRTRFGTPVKTSR